jgi:hypothetical protein
MLRGLVEVGHWAANSSIIEVLSKERRILSAAFSKRVTTKSGPAVAGRRCLSILF